MEKEVKQREGTMQLSLKEKIKLVSQEFLEETKNKEIYIISHFDTDGITSAAVAIKTLKILDKTFSVKIVKNLTKEIISKIPEDKTLLFIDLASNSLNYLKNRNQKIFIIDHHEINQEIPENVSIINPHLHSKEEISSAGLAYLFSKNICNTSHDLAPLGVIGMVGDSLQTITPTTKEIIEDANTIIKKSLLLYPSTRPIDRVLEFSSDPYIPSVTGNKEGVLELLREVGFERQNKKHKVLIDLTEEEMRKIATAIMLRRTKKENNEKLIGNIFLIKHFNQLEDARELSAKINAASRMGEPYTSILYCMENYKSKKNIEKIYAKYKQLITNGLKKINSMKKIEGKGFVIVNAESEISDSIIGVIASILSKSSLYPEGTVIVTMANTDNKELKVSARLSGDLGRNVREVMERATMGIKGEFGGHHAAAGCIIKKEYQKEFIDSLKKNLEIELIKV